MAKQYQTSKASKLTSITAWHDLARNRLGFLFLALLFGFGIIAYFGTGPGGNIDTGRNRPATTNDTVATVNGEPITRNEVDSAFNRVRQFSRGNDASAVQLEGMMLGQLVDQALLRGEAKKQGLKPSDADVDKQLADLKKGPDGKPLSDSDFQARLAEQNVTEDQLRDEIRRGLSGKVVMDRIAAKENVTEADLRKQYEEVKLRHILVSTSKLPDAQAKAKAEKILAEVKAGKDFATLADEYSDDPGNAPMKFDPKTKKQVPTGPKKGGFMDWAPATSYVPEFTDAALALKPGETSGLVKTQFGYHIIKLEDKRTKLPKDFDKDKAKLLDDLKQKKAQKPQQDFIDQTRKTAKIEWKDPGLKWKYDYNKLNGSMGMMMPTGGDHEKDQQAFVAELQAYVAKNPEDAQAQMILGKQLDNALMMASLPSMPGQPAKPQAPAADKDKLRAEVIAAYEGALKRSEDQQTRFRLAQLYQENKQPDKALDQYMKIKKFSAWDDSGSGSKFTHQQLAQRFKELGRADLAADEEKKVAELTAAEEKQKKEEAAAKAAEKQKASTVTVGPGSTGTVTATKPATILPGAKEKPAAATPSGESKSSAPKSGQ
jgi:peptidyl-prolyl cis-trans isomerase C